MSISIESNSTGAVWNSTGRTPRPQAQLDTFTAAPAAQHDLPVWSAVQAAVQAGPATLPSPVSTLVPHPDRPPMDPHLRTLADDRIYFVEVDRFFDGDTSNDYNVHRQDPNRWHGGDLQGLIDKADYIQSTGATAIWISPPMANEDNFVNTYDGYHGYWVEDLFNTDKHLGDMVKFKQMVKTYHDRGIKVLVDIPLNHTAYDHPFTRDPNKRDWFHHNGDVTDWNNDYQQQNYNIFGLPDLAQENPQVRDYLVKAAQFWMDTGIDGFRLDAVRSVPQSFWTDLDHSLHQRYGNNTVTLGEYYHDDPRRLAPFQRDADMDSLEDIPLYNTLVDTFAHGGSMRHLAGMLQWMNNTYPHPERMAAFLDDQDTERFLTSCQYDKYKMGLALAFLMTVNRVPTTFYGDEQSLTSYAGDNVRSNRSDMDFSHDPGMFRYYQLLASIRNDCEPLRHGTLLEMWQDDQIYAFDRQSAKGEAIVVLNNDASAQTRDIPLRAESRLANGTELVDVLTGNRVKVENGRLPCAINGHTAAIWVPV